MKTYHGLTSLVAARNTLPPTGWIFCDLNLSKEMPKELLHAKFYVPENEDDEFYGEDNLATWLETGIFKGVLELREKALPKPSIEQYAEAAIYYLVHDEFLE